jgi:DNA-binding response OmpR family regulator
MHCANDILIVDDDQPIVQMIIDVLTEEGYAVRAALSPHDARVAIAERRPSLMLCDIHMPGETGVALVSNLKNSGLADVPVIFMSADARAARKLSIDNSTLCLLKPFDIGELIDCIAQRLCRDRVVAI